MARLCSLTKTDTETNIFFFFIYTMSCFRKDLKRGDKHLVNTLDQMLKSVLGVVENARENTCFVLCVCFLPSVEFTIHLGRQDSLRRQLNHKSMGLGTGSLDS